MDQEPMRGKDSSEVWVAQQTMKKHAFEKGIYTRAHKLATARRWLFKCELYQTEWDEWLLLPVYVFDEMSANTSANN